MRIVEKLVAAAGAAASLAAIVWMIARLVSAVAFVLTPLREGTPAPIASEGGTAFEGSLPLFLVDTGQVVVSDSSGYIAFWDAHHAHFAALWAAAAQATTSLAVLAVTVAVLLLCIRLLRGVPFTRSLTHWVGAAGLTLALGGALAQLFSWLSRQQMIAAIAPTVETNGWRLPSSAVEFDIIPLACGAVLLLVAMAFSVGDRLRRDTEGLV